MRLLNNERYVITQKRIPRNTANTKLLYIYLLPSVLTARDDASTEKVCKSIRNCAKWNIICHIILTTEVLKQRKEKLMVRRSRSYIRKEIKQNGKEKKSSFTCHEKFRRKYDQSVDIFIFVAFKWTANN